MHDSNHGVNRRRILQTGAVLAAGAALAQVTPLSFAAGASAGYRFPKGFLWGAAIAGHQAKAITSTATPGCSKISSPPCSRNHRDRRWTTTACTPRISPRWQPWV